MKITKFFGLKANSTLGIECRHSRIGSRKQCWQTLRRTTLSGGNMLGHSFVQLQHFGSIRKQMLRFRPAHILSFKRSYGTTGVGLL
jgi:hypothetical protein